MNDQVAESAIDGLLGRWAGDEVGACFSVADSCSAVCECSVVVLSSHDSVNSPEGHPRWSCPSNGFGVDVAIGDVTPT